MNGLKVKLHLDYGTHDTHRALHNVTHISFAAHDLSFLSEIHGDVVTYRLNNVVLFSAAPEEEVHDGFGENI